MAQTDSNGGAGIGAAEARQMGLRPEIRLVEARTAKACGRAAEQRRVVEYITAEELELSIPPRLESIDQVVSYVYEQICVRWVTSGEDLYDVKLCLYEALVNALEHGCLQIGERKEDLLQLGSHAYLEYLEQRCREYPYRGHSISLRIRIGSDVLVVNVTDPGYGFDHSTWLCHDVGASQSSHGRGLMLVRELMDEVVFNPSGNQITMCKLRPTPPGSHSACEGQGR